MNLITDVKWEPFGGLKSWQWQMATGTQAHLRLYDGYGRLIRYPLGASLRELSYDAASRITAYKHYDTTSAAAQTSLDQNFGYDQNGRLTSVGANASTWSIGYDANGNRTGLTLNGTTSTYTTPATSNKLASLTNPARSLGYDAAGNTTSDSTSYTATYDAANRLATLVKSGVTTTYAYNTNGQRVRKFSSSGAASTVIFVYDQAGQLLGEYDSTGKAVREYVWLNDMPIAVFTPDTVVTNPPVVYYIQADHLNTPRVVINKSNQIRWRWLSEPFGTTAPETNPAGLGVFSFPLRFPGQYFDQESGLAYNWHRSADYTLNRYSQSDPIGLAGGINTYAYVNGQPTKYVDPRGLVKWTGEMYSVNAGAAVGGGQYWFDLKSECVKGKYAFIRVYASALGAGFGIKYVGGAQSVSFDDHLGTLQPERFGGGFKIVNAGFGILLTGGWNLLQLGANVADFSFVPSPGVGVDASIGGAVGASRVVSTEIKDCVCPQP